MFDLDSFATGMVSGVLTVGIVVGIIKACLWCGKTQNRITVVEANYKYVANTLNRIISDAKQIIVKGAKNDNATMVGSKPAGPA